MIISVLAAATLVAGAQAAPDQAYTVVDGLTVVAQPLEPVLTVNVDGDVRMESLIRSEPVGVRCGAHRYRYERLGSPRQCWMDTASGNEVVLTASDVGVYGGDWQVEWRGCEPFGAGDRCRLILNGQTEVQAVFIRRG